VNAFKCCSLESLQARGNDQNFLGPRGRAARAKKTNVNILVYLNCRTMVVGPRDGNFMVARSAPIMRFEMVTVNPGCSIYPYPMIITCIKPNLHTLTIEVTADLVVE
jgi:hypothetical protein